MQNRQPNGIGTENNYIEVRTREIVNSELIFTA